MSNTPSISAKIEREMGQLLTQSDSQGKSIDKVVDALDIVTKKQIVDGTKLDALHRREDERDLFLKEFTVNIEQNIKEVHCRVDVLEKDKIKVMTGAGMISFMVALLVAGFKLVR